MQKLSQLSIPNWVAHDAISEPLDNRFKFIAPGQTVQISKSGNIVRPYRLHSVGLVAAVFTNQMERPWKQTKWSGTICNTFDPPCAAKNLLGCMFPDLPQAILILERCKAKRRFQGLNHKKKANELRFCPAELQNLQKNANTPQKKAFPLLYIQNAFGNPKWAFGWAATSTWRLIFCFL